MLSYQLKGELRSDPVALENIRTTCGKLILATNEMDTLALPAKEMLSHYKEQGISVERGFCFLKDPLFFAHSLFLKSPAHFMALIMVMGFALLTFALAERHLRVRLKQENVTIPSQTGKPTQTPTMRWVFQTFEGVDLLSILQDDRVIMRKMLNLSPDHLPIIRLLGEQVQIFYSPSD